MIAARKLVPGEAVSRPPNEIALPFMGAAVVP